MSTPTDPPVPSPSQPPAEPPIGPPERIRLPDVSSVLPGDPSTWPDPPARGRCWFLGCPNTVPYEGGRQAKICDQTVDGLRHSRLNKSLLIRGKLHLPVPGEAAGAVDAAGEQAGSVDRPVRTARASFGQLLTQVQGTLAGLPGLVERMETAARMVTDSEQTAAEIASIERASRAQVDQAEGALADAQAQVRNYKQEATDAAKAKETAEEVAEDALSAEEDAREATAVANEAAAAAKKEAVEQLQRAEQAEEAAKTVRADLERVSRAAERQRTELTTELKTARGQVEQLQAQVATSKQQAAGLTEERNRLAGELTHERDRAGAAETNVARLAAELTGVREQLQQTEQAAEKAAQQHHAEREQLAGDLARERTRAGAAETNVARLTAELTAAGENLEQTRRAAKETIDPLRVELTAVRAQAEQHQAQHAQAQQQLATVTAQRDAETKLNNERVADLRDRATTAERQLAELRQHLATITPAAGPTDAPAAAENVGDAAGDQVDSGTDKPRRPSRGRRGQE